MRILWCITGAGEFLEDSIKVMGGVSGNKIGKITVFMSWAGEEVVKSYGLLDRIMEIGTVETEGTGYSSMKAGKVSLGEYDIVIVSPATANTIAKIANGIADGLITTAVSLAVKACIPIYVVPTDWLVKEVKIPGYVTPGGGLVHMKPRKSDLRNISYLQEEGIKIFESPEKLAKELKKLKVQ